MNISLPNKRLNSHIASLAVVLFTLLFGHSFASPIKHPLKPLVNHTGKSRIGRHTAFSNAIDTNGAKADTSAVGWYLDASKTPMLLILE